MNTLIIILIIIAIIALIIISIHNGIIGRFNAAERAWADVIAQERQKNKTLPEIEKMVSAYKIHESSILEETTRLRAMINQISSDDLDVDKLQAIQEKTGALINNLHAVAENYPELKASDLYRDFMRELSKVQGDIAAAIRIFNRNVEEFNTGIEIFPNSLINSRLTKKERLKTFDDQEASDGFDYTPNF